VAALSGRNEVLIDAAAAADLELVEAELQDAARLADTSTLSSWVNLRD
jgi:hypothetical protein